MQPATHTPTHRRTHTEPQHHRRNYTDNRTHIHTQTNKNQPQTYAGFALKVYAPGSNTTCTAPRSDREPLAAAHKHTSIVCVTRLKLFRCPFLECKTASSFERRMQPATDKLTPRSTHTEPQHHRTHAPNSPCALTACTQCAHRMRTMHPMRPTRPMHPTYAMHPNASNATNAPNATIACMP